MTVNKDDSIVSESTMESPSPSASSSIPVKRAVRTYGRPRDVAENIVDSSTDALEVGPSTRQTIYKARQLELDRKIRLSSDASPLLSDDEDDNNHSHNASPKFQFDWRKKLREIDDENNVDEMQAVSDHKNASESQEPPTQLSLFPRGPIDDIPPSPAQASSKALEEDVFGGSSAALTASSSSLSPPIEPRRRLTKRVVHDSDSESDHVDNKESPSNTSPAYPHSIATPPTHSSPTPPTSDDEMLAQPSAQMSKGKRKASVVAARSNVPPLRFSEEPTVSVKKAATKDKQGKKAKIKPPTKKELVETARNRHRLAAKQQASIPKVHVNKYSVQTFFQNLAADNKVSRPLDPSSPIGDFSDTGLVPVNLSFASVSASASTSTLLGDDTSPFQLPPRISQKAGSLKPMLSIGDLASDDDEFPEVGELINKEQDRQQKLQEMKLRIMANQTIKPAVDLDEDEDDLEVIPTSRMQVVVEEEEAERRAGKKRMSEGRKRQLNFGGIGLARQKAKETLVQESAFALTAGSPSKSNGKREGGRMSQGELNKVLAMRVLNENIQLTKKKEDEWTRRGGKLINDVEDPAPSVGNAWQAVYAQKGLKAVEASGAGMDISDEGEDGSDDDWMPEMRGSASPPPQREGDNDLDGPDEPEDLLEEVDTTMVNDENEPEGVIRELDEVERIKQRPRRSMAILDSDSEGDEANENLPPVQKVKPFFFGQPRMPGSPLSTQDSNDENVVPPPLPKPSMNHRGSLSSMDEPTEDENDKENNTSLMFDRSDDKENKAVVRHALSSKSPLGTRKGTLFDLEREMTRGLSMSPGLGSAEADTNNTENASEDGRRPLKDLLDEDPFLSPPSKLPTSFAVRLQQASPLAPLAPAGSLALSPFIGVKGKEGGFSQFLDGEPSSLGGVPLEPGFADLFESGTEKQKGTQSTKAQTFYLFEPFSVQPKPPLENFRRLGPSLDLTQDVILQPAFQVGNDGLLKKADQIFEKEQDYLLKAATKKPQKEPELYVNDHGFLTQTRPDVPSPEVYIPPSASRSQNTSYEPADSPTSQRRPLRTLSLTESADFESPEPLRRLRRVSPKSPMASMGYRSSPSNSPRGPKHKVNAFDLLSGAARTKIDKPKRKLEKSEFIEAEAQESDEDEMFGFGLGKKHDGEEEDGEELDVNLAALVDDRTMDEETVAAQLVMEKFKEQEEQDDREIEKLHQAAIQGELRKKKRHHGVGMNDSDDDSDEDDENRRIRRGMHKRQKIDRDNIKELGEHEETKSFFNVYEHSLLDNDNADFGYLQESQDVIMANHESEEEDEPREFVTREELQRRVREVAQEEVEDSLDPHDVSWIDEDRSEEVDEVRVKTVDVTRKQTGTRRGLDLDLDPSFEMPKSVVMAEGSRNRMQSWAKVEGRSRNAGTTGRSVGGSAVTGHKVKTGGGSLRNNKAGNTDSVGSGTTAELRRPPVKAVPSFLASVEADKSARFAQR